MEWTSELEIVGRALVAGLLGGVVGLEREIMGKPAGLRTHLLVAVACALFVDLALVTVGLFERTHGGEVLRADPIRIIEAIAAGISFIGAGTIIFDRSRGRLEGVTTAASILVTAGIGIAVGLSAYVAAVALTMLVAVVLHFLGRIERRFGWDQDAGLEPDAESDPGDLEAGAFPPRPRRS